MQSINKGVFTFILAACLLFGSLAIAEDATLQELLSLEAPTSEPLHDDGEISAMSPQEGELSQGAAEQNIPAEEDDPFKDIPDEYIEEANAFEGQCSSTSHMREYYDCKCLALAYLENRVEAGPRKSASSIVSDISNSCYDATEAAGRAYQECFGYSDTVIGARVPREEYCTCLANTFAGAFKEGGAKPSSKTFVRLRTTAMARCRNG